MNIGNFYYFYSEEKRKTIMRIWDIIVDKVIETVNNPEFNEEVEIEMGEMEEREVMELLDMSYEEVAKRIKKRLGI